MGRGTPRPITDGKKGVVPYTMPDEAHLALFFMNRGEK